MQRVRLTYSKGEELLYTGNLDVHKVWERTFRRSGLSLAYSQGFHPQPRINQACPLPLGFTGNNEMLDFWLNSDESISEIKEKLDRTVQPGITIHSYENIPLSSPPLQTLVIAAVYLANFEGIDQPADLETKIKNLLAQPDCMRERRGKTYDLLPLIESLSTIQTEPLILQMQLTTLPGATGRPEEVLDELGIDPYSVSISRLTLVFNIPS